MLEVNGVLLVNRSLDCLVELGMYRVVLVVGYKRENVKNYIGNQYKGVEIVYVERLRIEYLHV